MKKLFIALFLLIFFLMPALAFAGDVKFNSYNASRARERRVDTQLKRQQGALTAQQIKSEQQRQLVEQQLMLNEQRRQLNDQQERLNKQQHQLDDWQRQLNERQRLLLGQ